MAYKAFKTMFGWAAAATEGDKVAKVVLPVASRRRALSGVKGYPGPEDALLERIVRDLRLYFDGGNPDLSAYALKSGASGFRMRVWRRARRIPYGRTETYSSLALAAGSPGAARAAGSAMAANPFPIIVPCHRVVAARGMGGFSGGMHLKRRLLDLEMGR